jgi:hypothetical protein
MHYGQKTYVGKGDISPPFLASARDNVFLLRNPMLVNCTKHSSWESNSNLGSQKIADFYEIQISITPLIQPTQLLLGLFPMGQILQSVKLSPGIQLVPR